jgi:hypothetical protein
VREVQNKKGTSIMAIRIIQQGSTLHRATCAACSTEFEYEIGDVSHNYQRGGEHVGCPSCKRSVPHRRSVARSADA